MDPSSDGTEYTRWFIDSRAPKINSTFGVESQFNTSSSKYELKELIELRETLELVKEKAPGLVEDLEVDPTSCTWDDVLIELERAKDAALNNEKRTKDWYRRPLGWLGNNGPLISPGLAAFPGWLAPIHGGLAVVLSIARHHEQVRNKIIRAFENLPNVVQMAQSKASCFPPAEANLQSIRLHECLDHLHRTLLCTLPELIKRLDAGSFWKRATKAFKSAEIDHLLDEITISSERVRVCAQGLMDNVHVDTHKTVLNTRIGVDDLHSQVAEVLRRQVSLETQLDAISGKNWLFQFLKELSKPQLHQLHPPDYDPMDLSPSESPQTTPDPSTTITITPSELINILSVNHLSSLDDEYIVLRRGRSLPDEALGRTASMIQTPEIQQLLHSFEPGIVLVDGCADRSQIGTISPISFVCSNLAQALRRHDLTGQASPVMVFFCGQHVASNDPLQGPQGLVRSLLSQLVLLLVQNCWLEDGAGIGLPFDVPLSPAGSRRGNDYVYSGAGHESDDYFGGDNMGMGTEGVEEDGNILLTLSDLCRLFHSLLGLIPRETFIFCIVDGISSYQREVWRKDYELVLGLFGKIIMDARLSGLFKVLLTSPTISLPLPNDLIPHKKVSLRNERGSGYGSGIGRSFGHGYGYHPGVFDGSARVGRMGFGQNVPMSQY